MANSAEDNCMTISTLFWLMNFKIQMQLDFSFEKQFAVHQNSSVPVSRILVDVMLFKVNSLNLQASVKIWLIVCSGRQARRKMNALYT